MSMASTTSNEKVIPVAWIKKYGRENGPEIKDILDCMIDEYNSEQKHNKSSNSTKN